MRRLNVEAFSRRSINPFTSVFAARENERMRSFIVYHADFKVGVRWRN